MKARFESAHRAEVQRKKIEEQRAVGFRRQRNHLSLLIRPGVFVDPLQVRGLPAEAGTVIDEFAVNLASGKVYKRHNFLRLGDLIFYSTAPSTLQRAPLQSLSQLITVPLTRHPHPSATQPSRITS